MYGDTKTAKHRVKIGSGSASASNLLGKLSNARFSESKKESMTKALTRKIGSKK